MLTKDFVQGDFHFFLKNFRYVEEQCLALDDDLTEVIKNAQVKKLFKEGESIANTNSFDADRPASLL